jgi:hypothetical protein
MARMSNEPEPLVPPGTDLSKFDWLPLNVEHLLASELVAIGTPEECWAALMLWCRAWQQIPAGSLPNDERVLASFSGAGKRWSRVREIALRGFILCSDGRLYHRYLCTWVLRAQMKREATRKRVEAWRATRDQERVVTRYNGVTEHDGNAVVTLEREREIEKEIEREREKEKVDLDSDVVGVRSPRRGARLQQDVELSPDWAEAAQDARMRAALPDVDLATEFEKFRNYWLSKSGQNGTKLDWKRTWVNWVLSASPPRNGGGTPMMNFYEGAMRAADEYTEWQERQEQSRNNGTDHGSPYPLLDRK